jgi:hypothetical protein
MDVHPAPNSPSASGHCWYGSLSQHHPNFSSQCPGQYIDVRGSWLESAADRQQAQLLELIIAALREAFVHEFAIIRGWPTLRGLSLADAEIFEPPWR